MPAGSGCVDEFVQQPALAYARFSTDQNHTGGTRADQLQAFDQSPQGFHPSHQRHAPQALCHRGTVNGARRRFSFRHRAQRLQRGKTGGQVGMEHLEEALRTPQVFEAVVAEVEKRHPGGQIGLDQVCRGL